MMAIETATPQQTVVDEDVILIDALFPYEETNDPNKRAHIVNPPDNPHISYGYPNMEAQDVVDIARARQIPVKALCGHVFIPKHNPDKLDACEACIKIAGDIMREMGE